MPSKQVRTASNLPARPEHDRDDRKTNMPKNQRGKKTKHVSKAAFTYTLPLSHRNTCYTETLAHTQHFTQRRFKTQTLLHTDTFTHKSFYTQTLLHRCTSTHKHFYTQTSLHRNTLNYTQTLLHRDTFTHKSFDTQTLLHRCTCTHKH